MKPPRPVSGSTGTECAGQAPNPAGPGETGPPQRMFIAGRDGGARPVLDEESLAEGCRRLIDRRQRLAPARSRPKPN